MGAILFVGVFFLLFLGPAPFAQAVLYPPGGTLDPNCLPTDLNCGVQSVVATSTAGQIAYYATTGGVVSGTSSLVTTSTSTFAGLNIASLGLRVATLNASNCDLKATTNGVFYCGTDVSGGAPRKRTSGIYLIRN